MICSAVRRFLGMKNSLSGLGRTLPHNLDRNYSFQELLITALDLPAAITLITLNVRKAAFRPYEAHRSPLSYAVALKWHPTAGKISAGIPTAPRSFPQIISICLPIFLNVSSTRPKSSSEWVAMIVVRKRARSGETAGLTTAFV